MNMPSSNNGLAINNVGQIVGFGAQNGDYRAFLLNTIGTAVPEPATWAMIVAGFGVLGGAMWRRQVPALARYTTNG